MEVLDPTYEGGSDAFALPPRLKSLQGATVGIVSNGKKNTKPFFDALEKELIDNYGVATVVRRTKWNYSAPAEDAIMQEAKSWDALIAGIGD